MRYLLGTDEAGYGPNLGPLVISATVWEVPDGIDGEELFDHLQHVVAPAGTRVRDDACVLMGDSKALYSSGNGLQRLELGLWAAMHTLGRQPQTWRDVWQTLAPDAAEQLPLIPWLADFELAAPCDCAAEKVARQATAFQAGLLTAGVRVAAMRSRVIFEEEFNRLLDQHGSKGAALSMQTLALAARLIEELPDAATSIAVMCDKHGGRDRYAPLLAQHFPDWLIEVHGEGRHRSVYRFGPPERRIEFCFRTKAEACLPVALASMASKYLRELAMRAFNEFWQSRVPNLKPTAGYPQDAKRFRADIAETQRKLHIDDRVLWRNK